MRYALRNQDKIAAAYSSEYLKEHIIGSLDSYFNVPRSQEEVEDFIYSSCVCYSTNQGNYPIMQINDIADDIIDGWCCQLCGVYFEEEHGYPVVCESCYNELSEEEKKDYQLATNNEF